MSNIQETLRLLKNTPRKYEEYLAKQLANGGGGTPPGYQPVVWNSAYTTVYSNSATWSAGGDLTELSTASGGWNSTETTVNLNSASWDTHFNATDIIAASGNWDSTYTTVNSTSSIWDDQFNATDIIAASGGWDSTKTTVNTNSASWDTHFNATDIIAASGGWDSTETTVNANSSIWDDQFNSTDIIAASGNWDSTYTTVNSTSSTWAPWAPTDVIAGRFYDVGTINVNAAATDNLLPWDSEDFKTTGITHSTSVNNSRVYMDGAGKYLFSGGVACRTATTGGIIRYNGRVKFRINGTTTVNARFQPGYIRGDNDQHETNLVFSLILDLNDGDYVEVLVDREGVYSGTINTLAGESSLSVTALGGFQGVPGVSGSPGDITWEGDWSAGTYVLNQAVANNGSSYVCISASTIQEPPDTAWDILASKGDQGPSGSTAPYIHVTKTGVQNHGGPNGTILYVNWDGTELHKDSIFIHSIASNSSRIYVDTDGHYELKSNVGITQGGGARTTQMLRYRLDGTTAVTRGTSRNYSRGSAYGDMSVSLNTEMDLLSGQYLEIYTQIDDTDGSYTQNTKTDECEVILRKLD